VEGRPETFFTWSGDAALAYQVLGEGPDLMLLPPFSASIDWGWEDPGYARFLRRLASFSRVTITDRLGWGASDRFPPDRAPDLDLIVEGIAAVADAANTSRPVLMMAEESALWGLAAAAAHPQMFSKLIVFQGSPVWIRTDDLPWEQTEEAARSMLESIGRAHSTAEWHRRWVREHLPSRDGDQATIRWIAAGSRTVAGLGSSLEELRWYATLDMRARLPEIRQPTLLLNRPAYETWPIESSRYLAERLSDARLVELPGADAFPWAGEWEAVTDEIQEFLIGSREHPQLRRSLATVVFTDVVGSTVQAVDLGDAEWKALLERHNDALREILRRHHGTEIGTTGDGFFATFETAVEAVRCAVEMTQRVHDLGLEIRAGVHTGEVEQDGDDLRGIAVHIGARVMSLASPSEVFVSSTVKDLVAGSGLTFEDAGEHELKGVPDRWHLYRVT
jgi:class 3 adenylate cyclase